MRSPDRQAVWGVGGTGVGQHGSGQHEGLQQQGSGAHCTQHTDAQQGGGPLA